MTNLIRWIADKIGKPLQRQYIQRFIEPHFQRMINRGVDEDLAHVIVSLCIMSAEPPRYPGMILRDCITRIDAGESPEQIRDELEREVNHR